MAITYNAGTNTITVTGYTEATPCNFTDIYNADVAGGWGVVSRQCTHQFCFACKIVIGDGSTTTWVADTSKHIIFNSGLISADWQRIIEPKANATLRLGTLFSAANKTTGDGCTIHFKETAKHSYCIRGDGNIYLYSSGFMAYTKEARVYGAVRCWNSVFYAYCFLESTNTNVYNYQRSGATGGHSITIAAGTGTYDTIMSIANGTASIVYFAHTASTIRNVMGIGSSTYDVIASWSVGNSYIIDSDLVNAAWIFGWDNSPTATIYRQYSFDLKVVDKDNVAINGATVKIWDKDSNLVVDTTTNASGVIATQTITRGYYNQANGNTLQEASPHLIKIEKAGYTTYEADFTLEDKTDWLIALQVSGGLMRNPPMTGGMV